MIGADARGLQGFCPGGVALGVAPIRQPQQQTNLIINRQEKLTLYEMLNLYHNVKANLFDEKGI